MVALTTGGTNILIPAWDEEEWNYIYTGNGVSGFYSYGHQLEQAPTQLPTSRTIRAGVLRGGRMIQTL
jgi:hypothetical protein